MQIDRSHNHYIWLRMVVEMSIEMESMGNWLWFQSKTNQPYEITGKYLFFSEDIEILKKIANDEISNNGFHRAKINIEVMGTNTDHVLCLYYKDDSRKYELADKYKSIVKYRYWKSDQDTIEGKYSQDFLNKIDKDQASILQRNLNQFE